MRVEYSSNNSGGGWWLDDEDWKALEEAGWEVAWYKDRTDTFLPPDAEGRFLGTLAVNAVRKGLHLGEAVEEWERVTGESSMEVGCPCCGPPHFFVEYDDDGKWVDSGPEVSYEANW